MTRGWHIVFAVGVALFLCLGCSTEKVTELVLVIHAEDGVATEIDEVRIEATRGSDEEVRTVSVAGASSFPITLGVMSKGGSSDAITLVVVGSQNASQRIVWRAQTAFLPEKSKQLTIFLTSGCLGDGNTCSESQRCEQGACVDAEIDPAGLPDWSGDLSRPDAGQFDGGGCDENHADCNGSPADGCETDLRSSLEHCGDCETNCAELDHATATCEASACVVTGCEDGYDDCDGEITTGCEADLTALSSCGRCLHVCSSSCTGGYCDDDVVVEVASGASHSCARRQSGDVICWGSNANGRLGDGTSRTSSIPVPVQLPASANALALGDAHSCALSEESVYCWGSNASGQLGDGTTTDRSRPTPTAELGAVSQVSTGTAHTCVVLAKGAEVRCWGNNEQGQLGNGSRLSSATAVTVSIADVERLVTGASHTCALLTDGSVRCWGKNDRGQLGIGNVLTTQSSTPLQVSSIEKGGFRALAAGASSNHTCALGASSQVWCWGQGNRGQLGQGTTMDSASPVMAAAEVGEVETIAVGALHSCGVRDEGVPVCWGEGSSGQLGNGETMASTAPVTPRMFEDASQLALGNAHSCARDAFGRVYCWGLNIVGQLGDATTQNRSTPVGVRGLPNP